jgi:diguanylate cyclase (GGDEF)-like protein
MGNCKPPRADKDPSRKQRPFDGPRPRKSSNGWVDMAGKMGVSHRIAAYFGGFIVGTLSYMAWLYISGIEFFGCREGIEALNPNSLRAHPLSFILWQTVSVATSACLLYLWTRMRRYGWIVKQGANLDGLTGICSHRLLQEALETETARANRYGRPVAIIMFDVDDFKSANEEFGHNGGDDFLRWFAQLLEGSVRNVDIVARYGGDEFVAVLPETKAESAMIVAERIRAEVERASKERMATGLAGCSVSAGVSQLSPEVKSRHALLLAADVALYHAKLDGRNRVSEYSTDMHKAYRTDSSRLKSLLAADDDFGAIEALSAAVDAKDHCTRGHSDAVMAYSVALGKMLGMSPDELDTLKASALLHDIGKIGMPDAILKKQGALEDHEWEVVEGHPGVGSQILEKVQKLTGLVPGVKHHHERYDGMGYPQGLSGSSIPLFARIIALADAFDAMISDRSYRRAMEVRHALEEIERCSGTQFDPELVPLFIQVVEQELRLNKRLDAA